jgi:CRISPR-associated protein Cas1
MVYRGLGDMGKRAKIVNLVVDTFGNYLGMDNGCIVLRDKERNEQKFPLFESVIGEVVLTSGNSVSTGALSCLGFWGIDVLIATRNGRPIAMLKNLEDDAHVNTRITQYEALKNGKGTDIAKQIVIAKILGQNQLLKKYSLRQHDVMRAKEVINEIGITDLALLGKKLINIEGRFTRGYFEQIFQMFPYELRPNKRFGFQAYDGINNLFNLAYELLFWKVYRALSKSHLEPHLGFLHVLKWGRPSLVCDFEEIYRYLIDDFLIGFSKSMKPNDFAARTIMFNEKKGKRMYLNKTKTNELLKKLHDYFRSLVNVPRIKMGKRQEIESLINEEAFLLAKYVRSEKPNWTPRIAELR